MLIINEIVTREAVEDFSLDENVEMNYFLYSELTNAIGHFRRSGIRLSLEESKSSLLKRVVFLSYFDVFLHFYRKANLL